MFIGEGGSEVRLLEKPAGKKENKERSISPFYYFQKPRAVPEGLDHIKLTYISRGAPAAMEVYTSKSELVHSEPLPFHEGSTRTREYRFPLPEISVFFGFRFTAEDGNALPVVLDAGLAESGTGVYYAGNTLGTASGWEAWFTHSSERTFRIETGSGKEIFSLEYSYHPESVEELIEGLDVRCARGSEKKWRFYPKKGEHTVYFHCGGTGGEDQESAVFTLEIPPTPFSSVTFKPCEAEDLLLPGPIPADPGTVLHYPADAWRNEAYEVFAWNLFPKMLIFDTRDYEVQADFFKRLAFFVEKKGYTGQLLSNDELEGMHGWNAHDYRSIDLAAFFQAARDRRFPLNERERELRTILLENEILRFDQEHGLYLPVEGGCISISRSSTETLRDLFMVHEAVHGIFFSSELYRNASFEFWNSLHEDEQAYWELLFSWMSYDTGNLYLKVNELQAYLLQRPAEQAEYYFRNHRAVPAIKANPEKGMSAVEFLEMPGEPFKERAEEARTLLYETTGIWIDRLYCLEEE